MKTRRTRRYNSLGRRIYTTLNKTSRQPTYSNTEPRFVMTCQSRSNGGGKGCTNAGCGDQCCLLSFLVSDISFNNWMSDISGIGVGQTLLNAPNGAVIGTIKEIVFPCACCQVIGLIGDNSYNNFPLDMRILAKPASGSCANSRYTGGNLSTAQAGDISGNPTIEEKYEVLGTSNVGAPYRHPIKGWRQTLDCCPCPTYIVTTYGSESITILPSSRLIGIKVTSPNGYIGHIISATHKDLEYSTLVLSAGPEGDACVLTEGETLTVGPFYASAYLTYPFVIDKLTIAPGNYARSAAVHNIYRDNYSGPKSAGSGCCPGGGQARSGIQGRTHRPIIRSGMQPKPNICCSTGKAVPKCNISGTSGCVEENNYAYDYYQYLHNKRCKSFERSQEKFFPMVGGIQATMGTCPTSCRTSSGRGRCCQRSEYRKSGCCPECMCVCIQTVTFGVTPPDIQVGDSVTQTNTGTGYVATGTVTAVTLSEGGNFGTMDVEVTDCENRPFLTSASSGGAGGNLVISNYPDVSLFTVSTGTSGTAGGAKECNMSINKTTWKPNNRKFSKQGAVTSSGRLERLKLDTIRTANSKCPKGMPPHHPRCRTIVGRNGTSTQTFLAPKGPYLAGRPRFTGWIYNARHPERVCMLKYRQQPFGIPQLTNRQRATRSNRLVNVDPKARGVVGVWQRGNTNPRAPGCKCLAEGSPGCPHANCQAACGTGQMAINPGVPCCN